MKLTTLLSIVLIAVAVSACNHGTVKNASTEKADVPEPLKDNSSSIISKRSAYGVMMQAIYADQLTKHPDLQKLEDDLAHFYDGRPDSVKQFNTYAQKSKEYYESANQSLSDVKDSVLREQLKAIIAQSEHKYQDTTGRFSVLMQHIDSNIVRIEDYHAVLRIVTTLPVIENYQANSLPDIKGVATIANEAQRLKVKTRQLAKAYGGKSGY